MKTLPSNIPAPLAPLTPSSLLRVYFTFSNRHRDKTNNYWLNAPKYVLVTVLAYWLHRTENKL